MEYKVRETFTVSQFESMHRMKGTWAALQRGLREWSLEIHPPTRGEGGGGEGYSSVG